MSHCHLFRLSRKRCLCALLLRWHRSWMFRLICFLFLSASSRLRHLFVRLFAFGFGSTVFLNQSSGSQIHDSLTRRRRTGQLELVLHILKVGFFYLMELIFRSKIKHCLKRVEFWRNWNSKFSTTFQKTLFMLSKIFWKKLFPVFWDDYYFRFSRNCV